MATVLAAPSTAWSKYTVSLDEDVFIFEMAWNEREEYWYLTIYDTNDVVLISGVKLVPWVPVLANHPQEYLPKGQLMILDTQNEFGKGDGRVGRNDFGVRYILAYYSESEL